MEQKIGHVIHYFNNIGVAVLYLAEELRTGDRVHILGRTTDFIQEVHSLEISHKKIEVAKPKEEVALEVDEAVRGNDEIFKIIDE